MAGQSPDRKGRHKKEQLSAKAQRKDNIGCITEEVRMWHVIKGLVNHSNDE